MKDKPDLAAQVVAAAIAYVKAIDERSEVFEASRKAFLEGDESIDMKPRLDATWEAVQATYAAHEAAVKAIGEGT